MPTKKRKPKPVQSVKPVKTPQRVLNVGPLDISCSFEKDAPSGNLHMTLGSCSADISRGGEKLGSIRACLGGGLEVNIDGYSYFMGFGPIWEAVERAHKAWKESKP